MPIPEWLRWLEQTGMAVYIREYVWAHPTLVAIHMIGLTASVGLLFWIDLRLLGIGIQRCSVSRLYGLLKPWMVVSFFIMIASGGMMFAAYATLAYENLFFRIKMAAFFVAGINMLIYDLVTKRHIAGWDDAKLPPLPAQIAGFVSIIAWIVVILSGRMMAYTTYGLAS